MIRPSSEWFHTLTTDVFTLMLCTCRSFFPFRSTGSQSLIHHASVMVSVQFYLFWEELDKFKFLEAKCREKPWKVRGRTYVYGTKSPSRSEALRFIDSAKSPSTKIDGSLVNFRRRLSNRHGRPRRMLTMDIRRTPIGLWARLRDSHKSGPPSGWSFAWTLAQRNDWSGKSWPGYDIVVHEKSQTNLNAKKPNVVKTPEKSGLEPTAPNRLADRLRTRLVRIT